MAYGFACAPNAYLSSGWNILDFSIVVISVLVLFAEAVPAFRPLRALRLLRVLRPLRILSRLASMRLIMSSLIKSIPSVLNTAGVVFVFMVVFAILGMQLFSGSFGSCTDATITDRSLCVDKVGDGMMLSELAPTTAPPPLLRELAETAEVRLMPAAVAIITAPINGSVASAAAGAYGQLARPPATSRQGMQRRRRLDASYRRATTRRKLKGGRQGGKNNGEEGVEAESEPVRWMNPEFGSFDDFGSAMLLLYIASTGDAWEDMAYAAMDVVGLDQPPARNDFSPLVLYFIAWMFVGSFVALNLFVGVVVDNFARIQAEHDGSATMTPEQQQWVKAVRSALQQRPKRVVRPPESQLRRQLHAVASSKAFEATMLTAVVCNVTLMATDYWGIEQDVQYFKFYLAAHAVFTSLYYCEGILKVVAFSPSHYFSDSWCQFEFFLICTSLAESLAKNVLASFLPIPPMLLRVLRVARILRVLRLLKGVKGLRDLIWTLMISMPALGNVASLLCLVIFMYAVLGVNLFTYVQHGDALSEDRNFESVPHAALLLIQSLTADDWSALMFEASVTPERGCSYEEGNCGSPLAFAYFVSFMMIASFVLINLLVAVILENYAIIAGEDPNIASAPAVDAFKEAWAAFDYDAVGVIPVKFLPDVLLSLPPPLGLMGSTDRKGANRFCLHLNLRLHATTVKRATVEGISYVQVLDALLNDNAKKNGVTVAVVHEPEAKLADKQATPVILNEMLQLREASEIADVGTIDPSSPLTDRRRSVSAVYADDVLSDFIKRRSRRRDASEDSQQLLPAGGQRSHDEELERFSA